MNKKIEKLQKQLKDAQEMYTVVGIECKQNAEAGFYTQLKSAQQRSASLARKIMNLKSKISLELNKN